MIPLEELMTCFGRATFRRASRLLPLIPMIVLCTSCSDFWVSNSSTSTLAVSPTALILKAATAGTPPTPGDTFTLSAIATTVGGTTTDETSAATWTSSNASAVAVTGGVLSVVGTSGDATSVITASFGGQTGTANVLTYLGNTPTALVVGFPNTVNPGLISAGETFQMTATASLNTNPSHDVSRYVSWISTVPSVATVDANGNVTVLNTAVAGNTFMITATATFATGSVSGNSTTFTLPLI
jgi:hypothetical protein